MGVDGCDEARFFDGPPTTTSLAASPTSIRVASSCARTTGGAVNALLPLALGVRWPTPLTLGGALLLGFVISGLNLILFG